MIRISNLKNPEKRWAEDNRSNEKINLGCHPDEDDLERAFVWALSPQGGEYWKNLFEKLNKD